MKYTVYQSSAKKSDDYYTRMNLLGREKAFETYPIYHKLDMLSFFGPSNEEFVTVDEEVLNDYEVVAKVEASDLEHVFHLMNMWNDESKVERLHDRIWSLSVGDMVETSDGVKYIVDTAGYYEVNSNV